MPTLGSMLSDEQIRELADDLPAAADEATEIKQKIREAREASRRARRASKRDHQDMVARELRRRHGGRR